MLMLMFSTFTLDLPKWSKRNIIINKLKKIMCSIQDTIILIEKSSLGLCEFKTGKPFSVYCH